MDDIFSKLMLAYILFAVGFVLCVIALFVCGHSAYVDGMASKQYVQDCSSAVSVKSDPGDLGVCYVGQAKIVIVRQENVITHQHAYLNRADSNYTYFANLTLPGGAQVSSMISPAFGQAHISYGGDGQVEVWKKTVTQLTISHDVEETANNPAVKLHKDLVNIVLSVLGAIVFGGLAVFFNKRDSNLRYS